MNKKHTYIISKEEKKELQHRINTSIRKVQQKEKRNRKRFFYFSSAASVIILIGATFIYNYKKSSDTLYQYVEITNINNASLTDGTIKVIQNNKEVISLHEENPSITYSKTGKSIQVNNKKVAVSETTDTHTETFNTIVVPYGKRSFLTLSDGSKVWLNSGSKLTYASTFKKDKREVHLTGEAIFDVAHDKERPFHVLTHDYDVEVLGTVFNVSSYPEDSFTKTSLKSGSVKINYGTADFFGKRSSLKIIPGNQISYDRVSRKITRGKEDILACMSWRDGVFIFHKKNLSDIIKKASRYYNIDIESDHPEIEKLTFSGSLDLKDSIEEVLDVLKETTKFTYIKQDQKIIINYKNSPPMK